MLAALVLLASCEGMPDGAPGPGTVGPEGTQAPGGPGADPGVGSFSLSLTLGGGAPISEVSYDVSGNGFHKAGVIDVAASTTVATVIGGIPIGRGYLLQLTAQDTEHRLSGCTGSASFDIPTATTVPVPVHLSCHELPAAPQPVPVPRWASFALAALLLAAGGRISRRRRPHRSSR